MTRDEMKAEIRDVCLALDEYAYEIRCDWSDFDGRSLLGFVNGRTQEIRAALDRFTSEGENA